MWFAKGEEGFPNTGEEAAAGAAENEKTFRLEEEPEDEFNTIGAALVAKEEEDAPKENPVNEVEVVNTEEAKEFPPNLNIPEVLVLLEAALVPGL